MRNHLRRPRLLDVVGVVVFGVVVVGVVVGVVGVGVVGVGVVGGGVVGVGVVGGGGGVVGGGVVGVVGVVGGVVFSGGVVGVVGGVERSDRRASKRWVVSGIALRGAGGLLPATQREEYVEEWRAWLYDLREAGEPRYRRLANLLSIVLVAAPQLAITLRLSPRRVVG